MKKQIGFLFFVPFFFIGCSGASIKAYVSPTFMPGMLKSVAILPMQNVKMLPDETRQINNEIIQAFTNKIPSVTIIRPEEAVELLNKASLSDKYAEFLKNYSVSGIPNVNTLKEIGIALKVDAIVQGEVYEIIQSDGIPYHAAKTSLTVRYVMLSTIDGAVLWDAISSANKSLSALDVAPPLIEVIKLACEKVLASLPNMVE